MSETPSPTHVENGLIPTAESIWTKLLGPNYKVRRAGYLTAFNDSLLYLAILPYTLGSISDIIPSWLKGKITVVALVSKFLLKIAETKNSKQTDVTGKS